jgi:hypothetical protein
MFTVRLRLYGKINIEETRLPLFNIIAETSEQAIEEAKRLVSKRHGASLDNSTLEYLEKVNSVNVAKEVGANV